MWDRLRSATGGSGSPVDAATYQQQPTSLRPRNTRSSTLPLASSSTTSNSTPSWQPRSSAIAARQGQQQSRAVQAGPPPPRPPRDFDVPAGHQVPRSNTLPPSTSFYHQLQHGPRDSANGGRPASSIYSQTSPLVTDFGPRAGAYRYAAQSPDEVSPPSSPEDLRGVEMAPPNHDISPIDEEDDISHRKPRPLPDPPTEKMSGALALLPSQRNRAPHVETTTRETATGGRPTPAGARSNIPMVRRERRAQREADQAAKPPSSGGAPQRRPSTTERERRAGPVSPLRGLGISTVAPRAGDGAISPDRERQRGGGARNEQRAGTSGALAAAGLSPIDTRPGWKGASGRTAIVDPVKDNTAVAPLRIPPRSSRTAAGGRDEGGDSTKLRVGGGGGGGGGDSGGSAGSAGLGSLAVTRSRSPETWGGLIGGSGSAETSRIVTTITGGKGPVGKEGGPAAPGIAAHAAPAGATSTNPPASTTPFSAGRSLANTFRNFLSASSNLGNNNNNNHNTTTASKDDTSPASASSASRAARLFSGGTLATSASNSQRNSPAPTPTATTSDGTNPILWDTSSNASNASNLFQQPDPHGYPSPPLSGSTGYTVNIVGGRRSLSPGVHAQKQHQDPSIEQFHAQHDAQTTRPNHHSLLQKLSNSTLRSQTHSIRRKEVGRAVSGGVTVNTTTTLTSTPGNTLLLPNITHNPAANHRSHDSFSSSIYSSLSSRHDDEGHDTTDHRHQPLATSSATATTHPSRQLSQLNTKNLPGLPLGPVTAPAPKTTDSPATYNQPPSRFSVTTYATSAHTARSSPVGSFDAADAPPLPTPPKDIDLGLHNYGNMASTTTTTDPSVLARSRPEMRGGTNRWESPSPVDDAAPVKISLSKAWMTTAGANSAGVNVQNSPERTRRPAPQQPKAPRELASPNTAGGGMFGFLSGQKSPEVVSAGPQSLSAGSDDNDSLRAPSVMSNMDKSLPRAPAPPSTGLTPTTTDRITLLNATLQDLANRRMNINRAIKQMTELMPQDNLIMQEAVRRKREDEKRKIEELKGKLDDIGREEHDLGMKLHRAYKKLDQQTEYEPTTLWVRRATGA